MEQSLSFSWTWIHVHDLCHLNFVRLLLCNFKQMKGLLENEDQFD